MDSKSTLTSSLSTSLVSVPWSSCDSLQSGFVPCPHARKPFVVCLLWFPAFRAPLFEKHSSSFLAQRLLCLFAAKPRHTRHQRENNTDCRGWLVVSLLQLVIQAMILVTHSKGKQTEH